MASQNDQLHFLMIPFMSQSHIIPLTDFAKLLAIRGVKITIVTTPNNAPRSTAAIGRATDAGLDIRLAVVPFPFREAGLPEGCENMDSLTSPELKSRFFIASQMMQESLEKLIEDIKPRCIVSTNVLHWTSGLATKFGIPRYVFQTVSCFTLTCSRIITSSNIVDTKKSDSEPFLVPDIPHRVEFTKAQLPENFIKDSNSLKSLFEFMKEAERSSRGVLSNSFEELEKAYVEEYKKVVSSKNLWCIGPVCASNREDSDKLDRGKSSSIDAQDCLKWLDSMKPSSVIYVCFGSLCQIPPSQLIEIGLALEACEKPFIWIINKGSSEEVKKWLEEENFETRIEGRGLIIQGWAPQMLILSHIAVGGFLTHCGWNSTLEGICAGVPMITWPMFAEQFYNEKLLVNVLRVGVSVGAEVCVKWGEDQRKSNAFVQKERVVKAIEEVMDEGEEGKQRRERARELAEMGNKALEQGRGSSYKNITSFIQDVASQTV